MLKCLLSPVLNPDYCWLIYCCNSRTLLSKNCSQTVFLNAPIFPWSIFSLLWDAYLSGRQFFSKMFANFHLVVFIWQKIYSHVQNIFQQDLICVFGNVALLLISVFAVEVEQARFFAWAELELWALRRVEPVKMTLQLIKIGISELRPNLISIKIGLVELWAWASNWETNVWPGPLSPSPRWLHL